MLTGDELSDSSVSLSMTAGDFTEVYRHRFSSYDAVTTCFFIDTAKNILEYLVIIALSLRPGGRWINLGPLLYHFADTGEQSIELPLDDVYGAARVRPPPGPHEIPRVPYVATQMLGLREVTSSVVLSSYTDNPRAMSSVLYKSSFAIFEKEEVEPPVLKFFRGQDLPANCSQFLLLEDVAVISQSEEILCSKEVENIIGDTETLLKTMPGFRLAKPYTRQAPSSPTANTSTVSLLLQFESLTEAAAAQIELNGRSYHGKKLACSFIPSSYFSHQQTQTSGSTTRKRHAEDQLTAPNIPPHKK
mmetsp:Transcript_28472/g.72558  ORF Transcript_28472/g.72558 Transcript_28472/m.72558 type:complete len:303 (-) Transcript_28472:1190-2098(-)